MIIFLQKMNPKPYPNPNPFLVWVWIFLMTFIGGNVWFQPAMYELQLTPGPAVNLPNSQLIQKMFGFTNANAKVKGVRNWQAVPSEEMKVFLAFLIISNDLVEVPWDEQYFLSTWNTKIFHTPNSQCQKPFVFLKTIVPTKEVYLLFGLMACSL